MSWASLSLVRLMSKSTKNNHITDPSLGSMAALAEDRHPCQTILKSSIRTGAPIDGVVDRDQLWTWRGMTQITELGIRKNLKGTSPILWSGHQSCLILQRPEIRWTVANASCRPFSSQLPPNKVDEIKATAGHGGSTPPQLSRRQLLKQAVKDYGSTVLVFHVGISLASLGCFYAGVSSGIDMVSIVTHIPYIGSKIATSDLGTGASTFVVAYAVHKCFAPLRISITLTSTPFIVNYLRRKGVLK